MDNSLQAIKNLIYTYADRIDAGDYESLSQLFEHAVITAEAMDDPVQGSDNVLAMYTASTRKYPDTGTPKTKHVTTNLIIEVDEDNDRATGKAYYTVMQAVPESLALQPIIAGRYRDEFERVDGVWRFSRRHMYVDLVGDLSQHLLFEALTVPAAARFTREEVDEAFRFFYRLGCVVEDWTGWAELFTDDARYVEHFWGELHGRDEIRAWIDPVMSGVPEIYTVLEWYMVDGDRVVWRLQNRRDNPDPDGPPYFDFAGLSVAQYAGDGRWSYEEDYWDVRGARQTADDFAAACRKMQPDLRTKLSRRHWPEAPTFARFDGAAHPTWLGRDGVRPITKPRELRELLAPLRENP